MNETEQRNQALSRQKMNTRYEVRTKGDGEWDYFIHPSDPESELEANYDEGSLAEARRYAQALGGWVVEIATHNVPDCPYCEGSGMDANGPMGSLCPRCDSLMPPSTVSELTKAILSDVEAMRCKCPDPDLWREEEHQDDWFGPFSVTDAGFDASVQWPNLGILVAQLKDVLIGHEKVVIGTPLDKS